MKRDKRERQRLKRAQKRKTRSRREAEQAQGAARRLDATLAANEIFALLDAGHFARAADAAAQAAGAYPGDRRIAALFVEAAQSACDSVRARAALEHRYRLGDVPVQAVLALAQMYMTSGDPARARPLVLEARARFPGRMKERKMWLRLLCGLEQLCTLSPGSAEPVSPPRPEGDTLPLFPTAASPAVPAPAVRHDAPADGEPRPARSARRKPTATTKPPAEKRSGPSESAAPTPPSSIPPSLDIPVTVASEVEGLSALELTAVAALNDVRLAVLAAEIRAAESFDRLLAVEQARGILAFSHQEETARKVLASLRGRALLADEVGLGKTVEAGLVLSEYLLRGRIARALIVTPAGLVGQWREELETKFGITARTTDDPDLRTEPEQFWSAPGVVIASLPTARSPRQQALVTGREWDMVIVDEAHVLKNARTESYALVARLTSRFLLLLTATPIESRAEELYNLVSLIRPGHLGSRRDFLRRFADAKGRPSDAARRDTQALLGEIMIRNTRALSGVRLPPRFARTVMVKATAHEAELYAHLVEALRALGPRGHGRFLLSILLQEAGSSPNALRATLGKIGSEAAQPAETLAALAPAIACASALPETGKGTALLKQLEGNEATVIFTRFRATLDFLADLLARHGRAVERLDGDVPTRLRHEAIARCREHGGVLLSTDVGSEGLNLQFCRRVVNFDLPWNPARIEQRIGRIHRIGQDHPVEIVNLCLAGSIEERILRILDERINLFELVVGEVESILGYLELDREFADLVFEAFAEPENDTRDASFERIGDALAAARLRYQNVKQFDESFFRNALAV